MAPAPTLSVVCVPSRVANNQRKLLMKELLTDSDFEFRRYEIFYLLKIYSERLCVLAK